MHEGIFFVCPGVYFGVIMNLTEPRFFVSFIMLGGGGRNVAERDFTIEIF